MKIAVLGSAPSSIMKAPFGDASWEIWACSPGAYPHLARVTEFWEVHRWEPGIIGKAHTQKPWFSPEYVMWMKQQPLVWVSDPAALADLPNAKLLPIMELVAKYGNYCWTSSVAYMLAMAINKITEARATREVVEEDVIGLWGVDMAANEELYSGQRSACQWFLQFIAELGIGLFVPPESDLLLPPPMYGVSETSPRAIKWMERRRELEGRVASTNAQMQHLTAQLHFLHGALDDLSYHQTMWLHEGDCMGFDAGKLFPAIAAARAAQTPLKPQPQPLNFGGVIPPMSATEKS